MEVVEWLRIAGMQNISATATKYAVDRKRVREWYQKYDQLLDTNIGKGKKKRKLHTGGPLCSQQLDNDVYLYLEEERSEGRVVRNKDIKEKALEIARTLGLQQFMASSRWVSAWKQRWNVGYRRGTNTAQKIPVDFKEQLTHFRRSIVRYRELHGYHLCEIANMDQTMCR